MTEVYVIEALRTPLGSFGGELSDVEAPQLAATVIRELLRRASLSGEAVEEVIIGQVLSGGSGQAPARQAMRHAGLPDAIPAMTINKVCGSALKAIMLGAGSIRLGDADVVIAGGMENMSLAPYLLGKGRYGYRMGNGELIDLLVHDGLKDPYSGQHMGSIAEATTEKHNLTREDQDAFALRSHQRAVAAIEATEFPGEHLVRTAAFPYMLNPFQWAGVSDQYFAAAFLPNDPQNVAMVTLRNTLEIPRKASDPNNKQQDKVDVYGAAVGTPGGTTKARLYVGPKALSELESVRVPGITGAEPDLRALVDFGTILGPIARALFLWLKWTEKYIPNWGWALVVVTIIINALARLLVLTTTRRGTAHP